MQIILRENTYKNREGSNKKWLQKVSFMMTIDDYDNIKKTANSEGQHMATFIRLAISNELKRLEYNNEIKPMT